MVAWRGWPPRRLALLLAGLVLAQVALGIATLINAVPLGLALVHLLLAMFVLLAVSALLAVGALLRPMLRHDKASARWRRGGRVDFLAGALPW
ncbi:MAG: COX15/CtaA family protein [Beijerinckiaceae bacterium]